MGDWNESWTFRRHASSSPNNGTFRSVIKLLIIDFYFFIDHCFYTWAFSRLTYGNTGGLAPPRPRVWVTRTFWKFDETSRKVNIYVRRNGKVTKPLTPDWNNRTGRWSLLSMLVVPRWMRLFDNNRFRSISATYILSMSWADGVWLP